MRLWVVAAALSVAFGWILPAFAAPAPHVLVLNSYHPQYTWTEELVRGVREELAGLPPENLHIEFMDARRMVDDEKYLDLLAAAYAHKYDRYVPSVIISSDDSALNFLLARRNSLFVGIPIVFCGINSRTPEELEPIPNTTGIVEGLEVAGNLALIDRLHPRAKRVVLLADRTSLGQGMIQIANSALPRFQRPSRRIEIWDDFTLDELNRRVAEVDRDTVFLLLAIHEDRAGHYFSFTEHLKPLTEHANAPVYAMFGMLLGQGVTGGMMNDAHEHGKAAAAMALRVLQGTPIDDIPVVPSAEYLPRFDYQQLHRFGISVDALPPGSTVVGAPTSFYSVHRGLVWGAAAVFAVLLAALAWLTYLINRMRRAERELVARQEELRRAQQLKIIAALAGGIAHDFNNIITVIAGFTALAIEKCRASAGPLLDDLDQVERATRRAAGLTRQLLSFARRQPVQPVVVDLNQLLLDFHQVLRRLISEAIELVVVPAAEQACVRIDPGQLEQVLSNLATNARDAMPAGGRLSLTASVTSEEVVLRAADTGTGMTDEVKARIFEPFYTTKESGRGTGLGLATSFSIIEQARGSIEVQSELGHGTTFTIRFPRIFEAPSTSHKRSAALRPRTGGGLVLLVEDDLQVRRVASQVLKQHGFEILEAENGAIALELTKQPARRIDCVLTDLVMPMLGGIELVKALRRANLGVPIVVMSGYADDVSLIEEAKQLGARFISKPFVPDDLALMIDEAVAAARSERNAAASK